MPRPRLCVGVSSNVKRIRTPTQSREPVREFDRRKNAARAGALAFRPIAVNGLQGHSKSASTGEGTRPRSLRAASQPTFSQHGIPGHAHAKPWAWHPETETSKPTRSRPKHVPARLYPPTAPHPRAGTRGPEPCFEGAHGIRRCAGFSKSCASWKTPKIPSKVRSHFQDAHRKLRTFGQKPEWRRGRPTICWKTALYLRPLCAIQSGDKTELWTNGTTIRRAISTRR